LVHAVSTPGTVLSASGAKPVSGIIVRFQS
jgi:hypothetical protein